MRGFLPSWYFPNLHYHNTNYRSTNTGAEVWLTANVFEMLSMHFSAPRSSFSISWLTTSLALSKFRKQRLAWNTIHRRLYKSVFLAISSLHHQNDIYVWNVTINTLACLPGFVFHAFAIFFVRYLDEVIWGLGNNSTTHRLGNVHTVPHTTVSWGFFIYHVIRMARCFLSCTATLNAKCQNQEALQHQFFKRFLPIKICWRIGKSMKVHNLNNETSAEDTGWSINPFAQYSQVQMKTRFSKT